VALNSSSLRRQGSALPKEINNGWIMGDIVKILRRFEADIKNPENRGGSWELCYEFFRDDNGIRRKNVDEDLASLNLAFYLASWGMYRGSSFLLQKSYLIFRPIIKELFREDYENLWKLDKAAILGSNTKELWEKIEKLKNALHGLLLPVAKEVAGRRGKETEQPTDTLITKNNAWDDGLCAGIR
jgi:hypothetical protein